MDIQRIHHKISQYQKDGKRLFATSSFQTNSITLLHVLSRIDKDIPIYFINTGFHFPETISYKEKITRLLGIRVIDLFSHVPKVMQTNASGDLLFTFDPDYCCYLNKVQPVEKLMPQFDVWINGVRAAQNHIRKGFQEEQKTRDNILRYHPLLDWTNENVMAYMKYYDLPVHPLEAKGYKSIGCEPCTRPANGNSSRDGRWAGMKKTECGLHLGGGSSKVEGRG